MIKYKITYGVHNIYIERDFPEYHTVLKRVVARFEGWERLVDIMKKDILKEAQERFGLKKQVRHYNKKEEVI